MKREIFLDCSPNAVRAAVVEDGELCEIHDERSGSTKLTESLFYGRIEQIRPSVCAAFVNIGLEQNAFLPLSEIEEREPKLRCGDWIIVQGAAKQPTDSKGLRVSARINLAGKSLVLVPGGSGVRVSKKIKDGEERAALLEAASEVCPPGCGLIVRTASQAMTRELLSEEAAELFAKWQQAKRRADGMVSPGVLLQRLPLFSRLARELGTSDLERVVTNSPTCAWALEAERDKGFLPEQTRIEVFREEKQLLFDAFSLEERIDRALRRRIWLPCGGYLVLDSCEAMTVIDVNSGKMTLGHDLEETALRVNLEAAREVARQIRLRNVGGMIAVDFIDMAQEEHRDALTRAMRDAVRADRAQVKVYGLTRMGLMEIARKRTDEELRKRMRIGCSYCSSVGEVLSGDEVARRALYAVRRMALSGQRGPFVVRCAPGAASALSGLAAPEGTLVYALPSPGRHAEKFDIDQIGAEEAPPKGALPLAKG